EESRLLAERVETLQKQTSESLAQKEETKMLAERMESLERTNKSLIDRNESLAAENKSLSTENTAVRDQYQQALRDNSALIDKAVKATEAAEAAKHARPKISQEDWREVNERVDILMRENDALMEELKTKNGEVERLRLEISRQGKNLNTITQDLGDTRDHLTAVQEELDATLQRRAQLERELKMSADELMAAQNEIDGLHAEIRRYGVELRGALGKNGELASLEKRIGELEEKEVEGYQDVQRQIEKAEEAHLDRDKALVREQQAQREIQRLAAKLQELPAKCREKSEAEIAEMRNQLMADRRKHGEEMNALEITCANLQAQIERAVRDRRAAESELEKVSRHIPTENDRLAVTLEELGAKQIAERGEEAYRRLRRVERELEETKEDRVKMLSKLADLEHAHKNLNDAKIRAEKQHEADFAAVNEKYESQMSDLSSKLEHVSEAHAKTCREMQQLLILATLQSSLQSARARVDELEAMIARSESLRRDLATQTAEEKRVAAAVLARCREAEGRCEGLRRRVMEEAAKVGEGMEERKRLQRDLDRAVLEKERLERDIAYQSKQNDTGRLSARLRSAAADDRREDPSILHHTSTEVHNLRAELNRVKQRARAKHPLLSIDISSDHEEDDDDDEDEDDMELGLKA
ncbi:hypothetical protein BDK51DRAFT_33899, partial [Blyttiomyces helicus]